MRAALEGQYSAQERRALNQQWTCAGVYGFDPLFLGFQPDGTPDLYRNAVAGYACWICGLEELATLFESWAGDRRRDTLDSLAWLLLESAVYAEAVPARPALEGLRRSCAASFFQREQSLSRQEWMAKDQLAYTMETARWRAVLGKAPPPMTPGERKLYASLDGAGLTGAALLQAVRTALAEAGLFDGTARGVVPLRLRLRGRLAALVAKLVPTEIVKTDLARVEHSRPTANGSAPSLDTRRARVRLETKGARDRDYIRRCFGPLLCPSEALDAAEQALCTGTHLGCHLWLTAGAPDPEGSRDREAKSLAEQALEQAARNRAAFEKDAPLYQNAISRLSAQIRSSIQDRADCEPSRAGRLNGARAWRAALLQDGQIFQRRTESERAGFEVELLLDASASRLHCQETVAAQGYVLCESLRRCGVPVRATSFCTLRGYTVLRVLKDFPDAGGQAVFRYFATGWNRDGLALRAAGRLLRGTPGRRRLLLLLTDASPNDSFRIPPSPKSPFGQDYGGSAALDDTARAVRDLQRAGTRVAAIFLGEDGAASGAKTVYGRALVRIRKIEELSRAAGGLIAAELRALAED